MAGKWQTWGKYCNIPAEDMAVSHTTPTPKINRAELLEVASKAMQGLLASMTEMASIGSWDRETDEKAKYSVVIAQSLLNEVNKVCDGE